MSKFSKQDFNRKTIKCQETSLTKTPQNPSYGLILSVLFKLSKQNKKVYYAQTNIKSSSVGNAVKEISRKTGVKTHRPSIGSVT